MAITIGTLMSDAHELADDLGTKFSMLWDTILDDENGISEDGYTRLVELGNIIDPNFVSSVTRYVDATDGRFYIRSN